MPSSSAADQTPSIAYGLYDREPIRTPGGGLIMPDLPPEARTKEAHQERLNDSASWAEIVLQDWFKRIAVFGVSAQFDLDRFERATQALWRLTAVAKSVLAFDESSAGILPASAPADSSLGPRTAPSAEAPASQTATPSPTTPTDTPTDTPDSSPHSALPTPHLSSSAGFQPASSSPHSALATPHLSAPSVRAVPSCPTLSLEGIAAYLTRTEADLAEATRTTAPILAPIIPPTPASTPTPANPHPSHPSHLSLSSLESLPSLTSLSPSPRSALHTPHLTAPLRPHPS